MITESKRLVRRLNQLGTISDASDQLVRTFHSLSMRRANATVAGWMRSAGLKVREDALGNVIGRLEVSPTQSETLLFGSHLDTVIGAGKFDGPLGVLLPLSALEVLKRQGVVLPFAVEVIGFSDEEGVRFSSGYLGSKGYVGGLRTRDLKLRDGSGVTLNEALRRFNGSRFSLPKGPRWETILGYCEVHIEQGPVLERKRLSVGIVSAIAGQTRGQMTFFGRAGHAGTTPMAHRRDALVGASEFILSAESLAKSRPDLVVTVGSIAASPGAANVIPDEVIISLDVRHPRNEVRSAVLRSLLAEAKKIVRRRELSFVWKETQSDGAVECDPVLSGSLNASVRSLQRRSAALVSGAGHDAVVISQHAPVAMLFVRCRRGLSHHPDEYAAPADLDVALRVTVDFLKRMARSRRRQ
jgi:allantoate deiminase